MYLYCFVVLNLSQARVVILLFAFHLSQARVFIRFVGLAWLAGRFGQIGMILGLDQHGVVTFATLLSGLSGITLMAVVSGMVMSDVVVCVT